MTEEIREHLITRVMSFKMRRHDAEDIVQEAIIREFSYRGYKPERAAFSTYMNCLVHNKMVDSLRRSTARRTKATDPDNFDVCPATQPDEHIEEPETKRVRAALERLPDRHAELLSLVHGRNASYRVAAGHFGIPIGTSKSLAHRSLQLFKREYEAVG